MVFRDLMGDVLRTLWVHKLRTFLTMFGIAWGIVSIVLMVAAGEGLRKGQDEQARTFGKDVMIVFHGRTSMQAGGLRAGRLVQWQDSDIALVGADSSDCEYVIPELEQDTVRAHSNFNNAAYTVTGSYPPFAQLRSLVVSRTSRPGRPRHSIISLSLPNRLTNTRPASMKFVRRSVCCTASMLATRRPVRSGIRCRKPKLFVR